jgi:hypothetical protein
MVSTLDVEHNFLNPNYLESHLLGREALIKLSINLACNHIPWHKIGPIRCDRESTMLPNLSEFFFHYYYYYLNIN